MVRSMTAFSRQEQSGEFGELILELRSVNHRYLDISLRLPDELRSLESKLREQIASRLTRGKLDVSLRYQPPTQAGENLQLNMELVKELSKASREIDHVLYDHAPVNSMDLLRWPGVLQARTINTDALHAAVLTLLNAGLDDLIATREREGTKLAEVISLRCEAMTGVVREVKEKMPMIMQGWRDKLVARLQQAKLEVDPERLEQEIVYLAQKTDVDEEMDRLAMHITEVQRVLTEKNAIGRRLDFLMQELNREANTLGSKSVDVDTTRASVDLKVLIEQMREQVQNIE